MPDRAAVRVGGGQRERAGEQRAVAGMRHGEVDRRDACEKPMEAARQADDLEAARVQLRELQGDLVRLGARAEEHRSLEGRRQEPASRSARPRTGSESIQEFRWTTSRAPHPARRRCVDGCGRAWSNLPGREIEDPPAVGGLDPGALRACDGEGREVADVADEEALTLVVHGASLSKTRLVCQEQASTMRTWHCASTTLSVPMARQRSHASGELTPVLGGRRTTRATRRGALR